MRSLFFKLHEVANIQSALGSIESLKEGYPEVSRELDMLKSSLTVVNNKISEIRRSETNRRLREEFKLAGAAVKPVMQEQKKSRFGKLFLKRDE